jgi:hypothetical protein
MTGEGRLADPRDSDGRVRLVSGLSSWQGAPAGARPALGELEGQNVRPNWPCLAAATGIRRLPLFSPEGEVQRFDAATRNGTG